ncbi:MAG: hypothetical protein LBP29_04860 [Treponema sp.]|jgi:hypothetical protein|nr:hypothetical protein [Treponema sp.]
MNRKIPAVRPLFRALFVFAAAVLFSGCELYGTVGVDDVNRDGALPAMLVGKWAYTPPGSPVPAEIYTIAGNAGTYTVEYGYGGGSSPFDFKGTVKFVSNYSSDSGLIIIEYDNTAKPSYSGYNGKNFFAIYYRKLHSTWVQLANTTVLPAPAATSPDVDSVDEAKTKFTRMNTGLYVDWSNTQPQRRVQ